MGILSLLASLFKIKREELFGVFYIRTQQVLLLSQESHPHTAVLMAPTVLIRTKLENEEMSWSLSCVLMQSQGRAT